MACLPWHLLPTRPMPCINSFHSDVILNRSQISICSIKMYPARVAPARSHSFHFELSGSLIVFSFPGLSQVNESWISFQVLTEESIWTVQSSCLQSYDQSTLEPASNLYALKIMFSLGPYGKNYVCIWKYFVFSLCLRYFKCSLQTHIWENKQYWCCLWQGTYSHIKSIFKRTLINETRLILIWHFQKGYYSIRGSLGTPSQLILINFSSSDHL